MQLDRDLCWRAAVVMGLCGVWGQVGAQVVTYRLVEDNHVYRVQADGGVPEDMSVALDGLAPGTSDEWLNVSPDGSWLVVSSDRFDERCAGWECLAVVAADLTAGEAVLAGGQPVHGGFAAIASSGDLLVFSGGDGPHAQDLWVTTRAAVDWTVPVVLTTASPYEYNAHPAIAADGSTVVFDCGAVPYGQEGTAICEVGTDGSGLQVLLTPASLGATALHHPDYAPDGSVVLEADPDGEQIWRLAAGATTPELVGAAFGNDNSPCVLVDGRVASLWLGRPDGAGEHELKLMDATGTSHTMLLIDHDVWDIGLGCGGVSAAIFADGFESGGTTRWSLTAQSPSLVSPGPGG